MFSFLITDKYKKLHICDMANKYLFNKTSVKFNYVFSILITQIVAISQECNIFLIKINIYRKVMSRKTVAFPVNNSETPDVLQSLQYIKNSFSIKLKPIINFFLFF